MNNEQKNSYVKEQITKTLLLLLETKNIDDISISELTNAAEIGRVSFYRNYKSKEDILRQEAGRLLTQWGSIFQTMSSNDEYNSFFVSLFDFIQQLRRSTGRRACETLLIWNEPASDKFVIKGVAHSSWQGEPEKSTCDLE